MVVIVISPCGHANDINCQTFDFGHSMEESGSVLPKAAAGANTDTIQPGSQSSVHTSPQSSALAMHVLTAACDNQGVPLLGETLLAKNLSNASFEFYLQMATDTKLTDYASETYHGT